MRSACESKPARRPLPRQMDVGDWVSSTVVNNIGSTRECGRNMQMPRSLASSTSPSNFSLEHSPRSLRSWSAACSTKSDDPSSWHSQRSDSDARPRGVNRHSTDTRLASTTSVAYPRQPSRRGEWEKSECMTRKSDSCSRIDFEDQRGSSLARAHRQRFDRESIERAANHNESNNQPVLRDDRASSTRRNTSESYSAAWTQPDGARDTRLQKLSLPHDGDGSRCAAFPRQSLYNEASELHDQPRLDRDAESSRYSSAASRWSPRSDRHRRRLETQPASPPSERSSLHTFSVVTRSEDASNQSDCETADSSLTPDLYSAPRVARTPPRNASHRPSLTSSTSTATSCTHSALSNQRAELYAFRKDMREAFHRVDEMTDAHRDSFRTDPSSGVPVFSAAALEEAELFAASVFEELASLRARFRHLAMSFSEEAAPMDSADSGKPHSDEQDNQRSSATSALSIRTRDDDGESDRGYGKSSGSDDDGSVDGATSLVRDEDEPEGMSDSSTAAPLDSAGDGSSDSRSRRLSLSLEASSAASPSSRTPTLAESVRSSETSPPRSSSLGSNASSPVLVATALRTEGRDRHRGEDSGGDSIFKDLDRRMEEIRSSLSAIARGRKEVQRVRPAASSAADPFDAGRADRHRQLRQLLHELQAEDSSKA